MVCCPNGNECNHIITLGYLKSFIGENVKDSNGNVKHVTSSKDDNYHPTYSELTSGSLIPNFVDGGSGKWSLNVDGITVNGSYQPSQCVMQQDLVLTYTRFDSLTITATPATNIDACSGTSTMSYTYKLKKTVKSMNGSCSVGETSSTDNDTTNVIEYTSNQIWATISKPTVTISKNNPNNDGKSNARVATITGKITYKGENKTATATITQNGLTGSYKFWYSDYTIHSKDVTCNGSSFDCNGGSYSATAYYYEDDWDVYRYQDECGVNYDSDTEKRNERYNTYHEYDSYSGSFSNKAGQCGTWTDSKSWDEYGSCSWTQTCDECECEPYYEYSTTSASKSVGCDGGNVSISANVPYTYHNKHKDTSGNCIDDTSEGTSAHTIYVNVSSNAGNTSSRTITGTKDFIRYTITQSAGCTVKSVTSYTDVYAACEGGTNITGETTRTVATTGGCCATSSTTSRVSVNIGNLECNSGETRLIRDARDYKIYQYGRADCCTEPCKCTDLVVSGDKTIESDAATLVIGTYTAGCVTDIAASESVDWVTSISASGGSIKATVIENTSTESARTATITVTGKAGSDTCTKTFTVTQLAKSEPTGCSRFIVDGGSWNNVPASGDSTCDSAFLYIDGTAQFTPLSASSWVDIQFVHWDEDPHTYQYFCTVYTDAPCVANSLMKEAGIVDNTISCSDVPTPTMADMPQIVQDTITGNTKYTHALGTVRYNIAANNEGADRTCTIRWIVDSEECPSRDFTITQLASSGPTPTTCTCDDLTVSGLGAKITSDEQIRIKIGSYTADDCVTNIVATSSDSWVKNITLENGDFIAFVGRNNSTTDERTATITVTCKAGSDTCTKTFTVTQKADPVRDCYKGTDNGIDIFSGQIRDRKIFLCGGGDTTTQIGRQDSILVPGYELQWSKNGTTWTDLPEYPAASQIESWVKISRQGSFVFTQGEPYSSGSSERSTQIQFRAKYYPANSATTRDEVPLCETWGYHIVQCPVGYYWAGTHAYNVIMAECGSDPTLYPPYGNPPCDCDSPTPTTCTYTVNSNVEGATVTWSGGTMGTTKTTTIVGGTSSISIPCASTIRVTLTKEGCTFDDSNVHVHEGETVTINGTCSGPTPTCTCTATPTSTPLSSGVTSDVVVGSYSRSGDCPGDYSATKTSGADFLSITAFTGSNIRGNIISANTTSSARTATYVIKRGDTVCNNNFVVTQAAGSGPTPTCTCTATPVTTKLPSIITSSVTVGSYSRTGCSGEYSAIFVTGSGTDFLGNFIFSNYNITANVTSANPTTSTRTATYRIYKGDTLCSSNFTVTQAAGSPTPTCTTCSDANIQGLSGGANASGGTNILIGSFSYSCDPGLTAKRVSGGDFITNMTVNNGKVYGTVAANTATTSRTEDIGIYVGTSKCAQYTLTQQGATQSCNCNSVNMTTTSVIFDASGGTKTIGSITSGCTLNPLSTFSWGKLYQDGTSIKVSADTISSTTGRGTGVTYNVIGSTLNSCGTVTIGQKGQTPESWSINLRIANNDSVYHCIENVEIFLDTYGSIQTAQGECVNAGGEENLGTVSFNNTASAPEGATITRIEAVVNNGSGTGTIKTLTTNNSTLRNGNSYLFTLPAS